jgi:hypothetical protein
MPSHTTSFGSAAATQVASHPSAMVPLRSAQPASQRMSHAPSTHSAIACARPEHMLPHAPQLAASKSRSKSSSVRPSQSLSRLSQNSGTQVAQSGSVRSVRPSQSLSKPSEQLPSAADSAVADGAHSYSHPSTDVPFASTQPGVQSMMLHEPSAHSPVAFAGAQA